MGLAHWHDENQSGAVYRQLAACQDNLEALEAQIEVQMGEEASKAYAELQETMTDYQAIVARLSELLRVGYSLKVPTNKKGERIGDPLWESASRLRFAQPGKLRGLVFNAIFANIRADDREHQRLKAEGKYSPLVACMERLDAIRQAKGLKSKQELETDTDQVFRALMPRNVTAQQLGGAMRGLQSWAELEALKKTFVGQDRDTIEASLLRNVIPTLTLIQLRRRYSETSPWRSPTRVSEFSVSARWAGFVEALAAASKS